MSDVEDLLRETLAVCSQGAPAPDQLLTRVAARERHRRRVQVASAAGGVAVVVAGIVGTAALLGTGSSTRVGAPSTGGAARVTAGAETGEVVTPRSMSKILTPVDV